MTDLDASSVREHYENIAPVVEALADMDGSPTIGLNDYAGWYVKRDHDDFDAVDAGYEQEGRCATLAEDYETITGRIDRALYALTTYKDCEAVFDWEPCTITDGQTEWMDDAPTPGYGDLRGVMVWGDIDLVDDLKPQRGELDADTRETVEATLAAYADEFARLYGDRDAVFGLDSVGGAYIMGAPAATEPIAEHFENDHDARTRVMEALVDRSNEWLKDAQDRVESRVDGAADVIAPDWVNNCNRQYKAPLSLHTDHDAVVVPLHTDDPMYEAVPFDDVDEELIQDTADWAADLTSPDYREHTETLVKRLWPDEYDNAGDWEAALDAWVEAEREREQRQEEARKRAQERRRERKEQMRGGAEGAPITPFIEDVYDALDAIDTADVVKRHACDAWDTGRSTNDKTEFDPSWRKSSSGSSCYVDTSENTFGDPGLGGGGYAPKAMALGSSKIAYNDPSQDLNGEQWRQAVSELRAANYDVPVWTPDANSQTKDGDEYDEMPYWAVRKAAVALGVLPEDGFIRAQSDRGGYLRFPGKETYNHALAAIEDAGLEHNREYMSNDGDRPEDAEHTGDETADAAEGDEPTADSETASADADDNPDTSSKNDFASYSELDVQAGGYGYWKTNNDGDTWFERITNFTFDVDSFLFKDSERIIRMTVVPGTGEAEYELTVSADVFNDPRRFRDNVVTGLTTTFDGGSSDLNELRKLVGGQDAPVRTGTHHMGLHTDAAEFVTPNGVLTADGWEPNPENAYIDRDVAAERAFGLDTDTDDYDPKEITEILELLPQSRFSERFLPALGWLYAAPLRPYIQNWEGQFNTLHVTGETGAGKSSTLSVLWQLLGMDGEPMACDDTKFALLTAMASTNSIPMWFDEYKPGDMKDWEVDRFQNLMRSTTRGGVATRGNADKSTEEYQLKAPLMISGEQSIQGPAEQRRSIQTRFKDGVKASGSETKAAFAELTGMSYTKNGETCEPEGYNLGQHALAYYRFVLRQPPVALKELWTDARDHTRRLLARHGITGVDDLPRQGIQTIYFGMSLYRAFAEEMAGEVGMSTDGMDLPEQEDVNDAMLYIARQFGDEGSRKSHLDRFVELASRAATEEYLEDGKHYTLVKAGEADEQLALKLSSVHDRISKYVRDHGLESEDLLNSAGDYRDRMSEAADEPDSYVITHSQNTPPLARCARIDTDMAESNVEFSRLAFGAPAPESEDQEADGEENDPDGDGVRPDLPEQMDIGDIDPSAQDVASVVGGVGFAEYDGFDDGNGTPAWTATMEDGTGTAKLVVWDEDDIPPLYSAKGVFEPDALDVRGADVGEYNGTVQLTVSSTTQIQEATDEDQEQLTDADTTVSDTQAATDGGQSKTQQGSEDTADETDDSRAAVMDKLYNLVESHGNQPVETDELVAALEMADEKAEETVERLKTDGMIQKMNGGLIPT